MTTITRNSSLSNHTGVLSSSQNDVVSPELTLASSQRNYKHLLAPLDLTVSKTDNTHTNQTFDNLVQVNYANKEPLFSLRTARLNLDSQGTLVICDTSSSVNPLVSIQSLLIAAGFELVNNWENYYFCKKRTIIQQFIPFRQRMIIIKEAETPKEIQQYLNFLLHCYRAEQNYCPEIDNLFSNHSLTLLAFMEDKPDEIIGVGRYTHFLGEYGYYLPLQLAALQQKAEQGKHFTLPDNLTSMGEILALSNKSKEGSIAYLKILEEIMAYQHNIAKTDLTYTTYPQRDPSIGDRAQNRFGFKSVLQNNVPVCLKYGTFADEWYLLELNSSQIAYNYHHPEGMSRKRNPMVLSG